MIRPRFLVFIALLTFAACTKDPVVVGDNQAPPDGTVESVTKENYVNKLYISLLGRKATSAEFNAGLNTVEANGFSIMDRKALVTEIQNKSAFFDNEFKISCANLLNESDTNDARSWVNIFLQSIAATNNAQEKVWINAELQRIWPFIPLVDDLRDGSIDFVQLHKISVNNVLYDQVNMGTQNFVVSMFQNFFYRAPSDTVLADCKNMIENNVGKTPILFGQEGHSKHDFIEIFFASDEYFEGQVRAQFKRFLFREPNTEEMVKATVSYKNTKDFKALQTYVLTTNEYAGIH
jgi:hypothetical protein